MTRFIKGEERSQVMLLPECLDDFIGPDNTVRVVDAFVDALDLPALGFDGVTAAATGRPSYHPAVLLKRTLYLRRAWLLESLVWRAGIVMDLGHVLVFTRFSSKVDRRHRATRMPAHRSTHRQTIGEQQWD